jgi:hypothetical protein
MQFTSPDADVAAVTARSDDSDDAVAVFEGSLNKRCVEYRQQLRRPFMAAFSL